MRKDAISGFPVSSGSAEALVRCGGKIKYILIAYFLGNICAKNCRNRTVHVKIIGSCKGGTFFETQCSMTCPRIGFCVLHVACFKDIFFTFETCDGNGGVLQNGALVLVVTYGREMKADKFRVAPQDQRLDDGERHDVYFTRRDRQVRVHLTTT